VITAGVAIIRHRRIAGVNIDISTLRVPAGYKHGRIVTKFPARTSFYLYILHKSPLDPDPVGTPLPCTSIDTLALLWGGIRRPMASEGAMLKSMSIDMMVRSGWFFEELARLRSYVSYLPVDTAYVIDRFPKRRMISIDSSLPVSIRERSAHTSFRPVPLKSLNRQPYKHMHGRVSHPGPS
jgi:hypothetical protein